MRRWVVFRRWADPGCVAIDADAIVSVCEWDGTHCIVYFAVGMDTQSASVDGLLASVMKTIQPEGPWPPPSKL